jgi:hypothetical protein
MVCLSCKPFLQTPTFLCYDKSMATAINEYLINYLINIRNANQSDSSCRNTIKRRSKYTKADSKAVLFLQLASQLSGRRR